ncbi:branched-chain amino acid transport system II carrier protein [Heyndrickxia sporothermodurans]|uniref:Branched-chain amino acid transport system carrier protein n=3 Tax=Heyndrickxia sporothermodurans TaxID=46224 RepID=A0AB37HH38_9BACI|nr:branched-chain amino acid transport system II carrier protein [Heyndrickxia sporothermodurans]MBL5768509.1 branched-chain amino acid transport system II carrier protein [Heyndrickxia sporothermodurans]MBL5772196.1 branched-chain amino acid transport system II carrier protein [Heyndrickxia sporothermodurans]MBL5775768.1 branched-chain amino acid transport system II carrier protein [Heyndrickxia sporothermodurans]MBL5778670.1 branched-chain amino acid transport system II carrier protein [Heynd
MKKTLPFSQVLAIGFMLFAMFLGAGNVIFAPMVGQQAGTNTWIAMSGFLITGVGLVLLAIIALTRGGGTVEKLAGRVHPLFATIFSVLLFLTLGPIYVIPRTTSVVYEIAINPLVNDKINTSLYLFVFSALFIILTIFLSWNTTKFVDRLGKLITPIFGILLLILILKSIITPMGSIGEPQKNYLTGIFLKGFTQGYYTMDVLAAFVFGGIFIKSISTLGIKSEKEVSKLFIKAGLITIIGLIILQISMAWIGASSVEAIGYKDNGGEVLAQSAKALLGQMGIYIIGIVIFLTGITTNVACLAAVSEYFNRIFPSISYKKWLILFSILSLTITNFGLNTILSFASPILLLLYPLAIALIALIFTNNLFKGQRSVYIGTIIGVGVVAILDALKDANVSPNTINNIFEFIPLFENGAGWIITGIVGSIIGLIVAKTRKEPAVFINMAGQEIRD